MSKFNGNFLRRGEAHHRARYTAAQVSAMREEYRTTVTTCEALAAKYGGSVSNIALILSGKTWRHLLEKKP